MCELPILNELYIALCDDQINAESYPAGIAVCNIQYLRGKDMYVSSGGIICKV